MQEVSMVSERGHMTSPAHLPSRLGNNHITTSSPQDLETVIILKSLDSLFFS